MVRALTVFATIALGASVALAQRDPIRERKELLKNNADQAKIGAAMVKGEEQGSSAVAWSIEFSGNKAAAFVAVFSNAAKIFCALARSKSRKSGRAWMTSKQGSTSLAVMPRQPARA
jgi:hypothetical protein